MESIPVRGRDRYELLEGVTQARRELTQAAQGFVESLQSVCGELYRRWGITGILVILGDERPWETNIEYLGQSYLLKLAISRDTQVAADGRHEFAYYLELTTWKRIPCATGSSEREAPEGSSTDVWHPLPTSRLVDRNGRLYRGSEKEAASSGAEEPLRDFVVELLLSEDCGE